MLRTISKCPSRLPSVQEPPKKSLFLTCQRNHFPKNLHHFSKLNLPPRFPCSTLRNFSTQHELARKGLPAAVSFQPPSDSSVKPLTEEEFCRIVDNLSFPDGPIGVAVSGAAESIALAVLCQKWAKKHKRPFRTVTVDHAFRNGTEKDVQWVHDALTQKGIPNDVLKINWKEEEVLLKKRIALAHEKRHRLFASWSTKNDIKTLFFGQPVESQMEGFLIRYARASGIDGLSCLSAVSNYLQYFHVVRPFLSISRKRLIATCNEARIGYLVDSTNENTDFLRTNISNYIEKTPNIHQDLEIVRNRCEIIKNDYKTLVDYFLQTYAMLSKQGGFMFLRLNELRSTPKVIAERILVRVLPVVAGKLKAPSGAALSNVIDKLKYFELDNTDEYSLEGGFWKTTNSADWFAQRKTEVSSSHRSSESVSFPNPFQVTISGCLLRYVRYRSIHCILVQAERIAPPFETVSLSLNESKVWEGRFVVSVKRHNSSSTSASPSPSPKFYCRRLSYEEWPQLLAIRSLSNKLKARSSSLDLVMVQPAFFTADNKFVALPFLGINLLNDMIFEASFYPLKQMLVNEEIELV